MFMDSSHGFDVEGRCMRVMTEQEWVTTRTFCDGILTGNVSMICPIWAAATVRKAGIAQMHSQFSALMAWHFSGLGDFPAG